MTKPIFGPGNRALIWNGEWGREKELRHPKTHQLVKMSNDMLTEWMGASERRTYIGEDGQARIKYRTFERPGPDGEPETVVEYATIDHPHALIVVGEDIWKAWRETAK